MYTKKIGVISSVKKSPLVRRHTGIHPEFTCIRLWQDFYFAMAAKHEHWRRKISGEQQTNEMNKNLFNAGITVESCTLMILYYTLSTFFYLNIKTSFEEHSTHRQLFLTLNLRTVDDEESALRK